MSFENANYRFSISGVVVFAVLAVALKSIGVFEASVIRNAYLDLEGYLRKLTRQSR